MTNVISLAQTPLHDIPNMLRELATRIEETPKDQRPDGLVVVTSDFPPTIYGYGCADAERATAILARALHELCSMSRPPRD